MIYCGTFYDVFSLKSWWWETIRNINLLLFFADQKLQQSSAKQKHRASARKRKAPEGLGSTKSLKPRFSKSWSSRSVTCLSMRRKIHQITSRLYRCVLLWLFVLSSSCQLVVVQKSFVNMISFCFTSFASFRSKWLFTLSETKTAPENRPCQKEISSSKNFQALIFTDMLV